MTVSSSIHATNESTPSAIRDASLRPRQIEGERTSLTHQVRVSLVDLLFPPLALLLELARLLTGDGNFDVEDSAMHNKVSSEGRGRINRQNGRGCERVGRTVSDLKPEYGRHHQCEDANSVWAVIRKSWRDGRTGTELAPLPVSTLINLACSTARSASSRFQKQTKPVPRDRPVALSMVILAYRRGP